MVMKKIMMIKNDNGDEVYSDFAYLGIIMAMMWRCDIKVMMEVLIA